MGQICSCRQIALVFEHKRMLNKADLAEGHRDKIIGDFGLSQDR